MDGPSPHSDSRALQAVATQFFVNGAVFASFVPRLPEIRDQVGITVTQVGLLLSIAGLSGLAGSAVVSPAITRLGTRRVMLLGGSIISLSLGVVGLARSPLLLLVGLAGMLAFDVLVDVAMNLQGSWLSARRHAPVMNRLHGLWSLGILIGGFAASRVAAAGVSVRGHLLAASGVLLLVCVNVSRHTLGVDGGPAPSSGRDQATAHHSKGRPPALVFFLLAGAFALAIEATSIDWAAFRLVDDFGAEPGFAALGYVAVAGGMTAIRFVGDWMVVRLGTDRLLRAAAVAAAVGLAVACLTPSRYVSLAGFLVAGTGIGALMPALYDSAARHEGRPGAGLGALTAGLRIAAFVVPLAVGALAGSQLSVGAAVALVTLPSASFFLAVHTRIGRL
ncbi:MAG: MFS transporter [Actinomycetia bacterium]|nr:MFS transporter [Actinomycetes bacterium]